jgi:hypothetical protein
VVSEATSLVEGWQDAGRLHCDHVLEATITGWDDTSSEWRENPDRLAVRLEIWRVSDRALVAWADKEVVGHTPQDLKQTPHTLAPRLVAELLDPILTGRVVPPPDDGED